MSFSDTLERIVGRIEGAVAAVILGVDGIPIDRHVGGLDADLDIELMATELTTLLRRSMRTASDTSLGELHELVIKTDRISFLLRPITAEYFLLLALAPGGNVGRARYELRKAQMVLLAEFAI